MSGYWMMLNRLAKEDLCVRLSLEIASLIDDEEALFRSRLDRFQQLTALGQWQEAEAMWKILDPMGRKW